MYEMNKFLESIKQNFHKYVIKESISRIKQCLEKVTEEQVWQPPNQNSNSIGNLI